jgi:hypothetical protein
MEYHIISADDHIDMPWLPKDLWQKRVPRSGESARPEWPTPRTARTGCAAMTGWDAWGGRKGAALGGRRSALERGGVLEPGVLRPTTTALGSRTWRGTASTPP